MRPPLRALAAAALAATLAACAHGPAPLYQWGEFPHHQYDTLRGEGKSPAEQITALEAQAQQVEAAHTALPPGFRAHLGLLYLDAGDAAKARAMWQAEKSAFPESALYMDQLLKRLDGPVQAAQGKEIPA